MAARVLFINGLSIIGGAETDLLAMLHTLDREQVQPHVICPPEGDLIKEVRALGISVQPFRLPYWRKVRDWPLIPSAIFSLACQFERWNIDLVHLNEYWWVPVVWLAARLKHVPCVVHIRQQIEPKKIKQYWLNYPHRLLAVSKAIRRVVVDAGIPENRVEVMYSGFHRSRVRLDVDGQTIRRRYHLNETQSVIGTVANLFPRKGYEFLLYAISELRPTVPDLHCFIVGEGDGAYHEQLTRLAQKLGITRCVTFTGFQHRVDEIISAFDVFVLPSILEGFGLVLLEAMALGKSVVASRVGGIPEIVQDGITGLLVPPRDTSQLASAILILLRDPSLRKIMGEAGRQRVAACFSMDQTMSMLYDVYRSVLNAKSLRTQNHKFPNR